jgi:hypothetical protein
LSEESAWGTRVAALKAKKLLYMTATSHDLLAHNDPLKEVFRYEMGDAIKDKHVLDYVVYYGNARNGHNIVDDTMMFLANTPPNTPPSHVMSFAATKDDAESFCRSDFFDVRHTFFSHPYNGAKINAENLAKFKASPSALLSAVRMGGEGIDMPNVDAVVFATAGPIDAVRVVQALGRTVRRNGDSPARGIMRINRSPAQLCSVIKALWLYDYRLRRPHDVASAVAELFKPCDGVVGDNEYIISRLRWLDELTPPGGGFDGPRPGPGRDNTSGTLASSLRGLSEHELQDDLELWSVPSIAELRSAIYDPSLLLPKPVEPLAPPPLLLLLVLPKEATKLAPLKLLASSLAGLPAETRAALAPAWVSYALSAPKRHNQLYKELSKLPSVRSLCGGSGELVGAVLVAVRVSDSCSAAAFSHVLSDSSDESADSLRRWMLRALDGGIELSNATDTLYDILDVPMPPPPPQGPSPDSPPPSRQGPSPDSPPPSGHSFNADKAIDRELSASSGFLYLISEGFAIGDRHFKVGRSIKPESRVLQLQTGNPRKLELVRVWPRGGGDQGFRSGVSQLEAAVLDKLSSSGFTQRCVDGEGGGGTEWFRLLSSSGLTEVDSLISDVIICTLESRAF